MAREPDQESTEAQRLRRLIAALGYENDNLFADRVGVSPQRLNNVLNGSPLGKDFAFLLVQKIPGLSLDWLYFGKREGLSVHMAELLGEVPPSRRKATTGRS